MDTEYNERSYDGRRGVEGFAEMFHVWWTFPEARPRGLLADGRELLLLAPERRGLRVRVAQRAQQWARQGWNRSSR